MSQLLISFIDKDHELEKLEIKKTQKHFQENLIRNF